MGAGQGAAAVGWPKANGRGQMTRGLHSARALTRAGVRLYDPFSYGLAKPAGVGE